MAERTNKLATLSSKIGKVKKLYLYVVTTIEPNYEPWVKSAKEGMSAPNVVDKLITLGTCKPRIRVALKKSFKDFDNYIVGLSPSNTDPRRVLFIMHVREIITFDEAWKRGKSNKNYKLKRGGNSPIDGLPKVKMNGDIIVRLTDGIHYTFVKGVHEKDWAEYIIGGKKVLSPRDIYVVGDEESSRYFGGLGPVFTLDMFKQYWKGYPNLRNHRVLCGKDAEALLANFSQENL